MTVNTQELRELVERATPGPWTWYSAMGSTWTAQTEMFIAMCEGRAPWQMHAVSKGETA